MENIQTSLIDINQVLKNKNPTLYKRLPKFIINLIRKIIRENELNDFLRACNNSFGIDFLHKSFEWFNVKANVIGAEHFPENSRIIIVANHPAGSFDGLHIIDTCFTKYGKAKALVNDLLLNVKNLNDFFMGVNKYGSTPREYLAEISRTFDSDDPIIFFPAGYVSRKKAGVIRDLEWKKSFVSQAIKHKRDIIPIHISGNLSNKFYFTANTRQTLRIKANLELFLLPQELTKQRNSVYQIKVGEPILYQNLSTNYTEYDWAQKIKHYVYELSKDVNTTFMYE